MSFISNLFGGGGGSSSNNNSSGAGTGSTQSTSTSYNTNIPEYAQPYVTSMLNATQQQLFNVDDNGQITGFNPYRAYGGTYDASGKQLSYDPSKGIAGFSPLQQQVQKDVAGLKTPEGYSQAAGMTGQAALDTMRNANREAMAGMEYQRQATNPYAVQAYMNPYVQASLAPQLQLLAQQTGIQGANQQSAATSAGAFGGSRSALANSLVQQQGNLAAQQALASGYNQAFNQAQQAQQYAANLGLQGRQAAQAGYGQYGTLANQLAGISTQELAARQAILNQQNVVGAQQQGLQQTILNQAMQDYANAQQYPLMQLGTMSNMLRGLPLQSTTTQQYVAQPNATTQAIGTIGSLASLYNATKAKGGIIDADKYASGGVIDSVESKLYDMEIPELQKELKSPSGEVRKMARRIMMEKSVEGKAGGGIIAFSNPTDENNQSLVQEPETAADVRYAPPTELQPRGIVAVPVDPQIGTSPEEIKKALALGAQRQLGIANAPTSAGADERAAYIGPDVAGQEYRRRVMEERANSKDEAIRQNWMRAAEFFADWGSRPGNTLSAGMLALKQVIPGIVTDKKAQKEYERGVDKVMYELDKAARAEKAGNFDKQVEHQEKAGQIGERYLGSLSNLVGHEETARATLEAARIRARDGGDDKWAKSVQRAELEFKNDPKTQSMMKEMKRREDDGTMTPKDRSYYELELDKIRNWHYDNNKIGRPSSPVERGMSPSETESRKAELEKKIEKNTPFFGKPNAAQERAIREAKDELNVLSGIKPTPTNEDGSAVQKPAEAAPPSGLPSVKSQKDYDKLQKGDKYRDPDGNIRTKG